MHPVAKRVILLAAATTLWGRVAAAEGDRGPQVTAAPAEPGTGSAAPATVHMDEGNAEPSPPLSDAEMQAQAEAGAGEQITIFAERPDKPFDRDTEVRLTGEQLAARGATDLASALALLSDVTVRDGGRGGFNIDVRGGRKGEVSILIDGVLVTDPYYGTYDLSSIPITDIVQIRISTTPQSPIDGPGGPGGVIEVHTRDAIGPQIVIARMTGDSLPSYGVTGSARAALAKNLALRMSASGTMGGRSLTLKAPFDQIDQNLRDANGAARLEYREGKRRIALDGFLDDRHYVVPPNEESTAVQLIDRETSARASVKADDTWGTTQVQASAWEHYLLRRSHNFMDPTETVDQQYELLSGFRTGAQALVTRPISKEVRWAASTTVDNEQATDTVRTTTNRTTGTGDTTIVEAAGDLQYERETLRLDGAAGVAVPFGVGADPWPEGKAVAKWRPYYGHLELTATGGYKGRVPSLRERFDPNSGNPALGPEKTAHGELRAIEHIDDRIHVEVAPFYRHQTGTVRLDPTTDMTSPTFRKEINLGIVNFYGLDLMGRVRAQRMVEVGGGYSYVKAHSDTTGDDPLDRLPHNRFDAWAQVTPRAGLSGLVRAIYFGDNKNGGMVLQGYTTVQATLTWQIDRQYLAVLRGDDLSNTRPETRPGVFGPGRTVSVVFQGSWE